MTGLVRFLSFVDHAPNWISRIKRITNKLSTVESIGRWSLDLYVIRINPVHGRRKIAFPLYTWNSFLLPSIFLLHSRPVSLPKIPLRGYSLLPVHFLLWSVLNRTRYRRNSIVTDEKTLLNIVALSINWIRWKMNGKFSFFNISLMKLA